MMRRNVMKIHVEPLRPVVGLSREAGWLSAALAVALLVASGCAPSQPAQFVIKSDPRKAVENDLTGVKKSLAELDEKYSKLIAEAKSDADKKELEERRETERKDLKASLESIDNDLAEGLPKREKTRASVLVAMFGTPDEPFVLPETGLNAQKIKLAAGPAYSDQQGTSFGLYRRHCVHCHGTTGDGAGPTAAFLNPYPRDFRHGTFKFKSTALGEKPTDDDLRRILMEGVHGTAMPSFKTLPQSELDALVEYVKYLAIRGEFEGNVQNGLISLIDEEFDVMELKQDMVDMVAELGDKWKRAPESIVLPESEPPVRTSEELRESIAAGRKLFYGPVANCLQCHGPTALGDGQIYFLNAPEGTPNRFPEKDVNKLVNPDLPMTKLQPRNLRLGFYRGGSRPLDIYRRMHVGIDGTPMPAVPRGATGLTDEQVWNLVDFVLSLPYELAEPTDDLLPENSRPVH
jgi:mono/diheme cytochrome c family protein